ncbi:MAG: hypothetical protein HQM08_10020 [Candidatus Riflebacteria bacterium]|nr:hypothetical protein [Candidatus Riflebacteria bacterium]
MAFDPVCDKFLDELTGNKPFSSELTEHLSKCQNCREMCDTLNEIKTQDSAFSAGSTAELKRAVLENTLLANSSILIPQPSWKIAIIGISLAIILTLGSEVFHFFQKALPQAKNSFPTLFIDGASQSFPLSLPMELKKTAIISVSENLTIFSEPDTSISLASESMKLLRGTITLNLKSDRGIFTISTPDTLIEGCMGLVKISFFQGVTKVTPIHGHWKENKTKSGESLLSPKLKGPGISAFAVINSQASAGSSIPPSSSNSSRPILNSDQESGK